MPSESERMIVRRLDRHDRPVTRVQFRKTWGERGFLHAYLPAARASEIQDETVHRLSHGRFGPCLKQSSRTLKVLAPFRPLVRCRAGQYVRERPTLACVLLFAGPGNRLKQD